MFNLPPCKFQVGQRVRVRDVDSETGELYAEEMPDEYWKGFWGQPGYTYFIEFDSPRVFRDDAHETVLMDAES